MYRRPSKRTLFIRRMFIYALMFVSIVVIVGVVLLFLLGYRLDSQNGGIEQGALLQFDTEPPGANVTIDGKSISAQTPTKSTVLAGSHTVTMTKDGYDTWTKTVNLTAGTLTWLDYALLIPKDRPVENVANYQTLAGVMASPDNKTILIQQSPSEPTFQVVDLQSLQIKTTTVVLPTNAYSQAGVAGVTHTFTLSSWDKNGRFVLLKHTYADKTEWIVMDTQNISNSKNITQLLDVDLTKVEFSGTSGNIFYGLTGGTVRKLDLGATTISGPYISDADDFELFDTNVVTYTGTDPNDPTKHVAGVYQEGDASSYVLKTATTNDGFHIATTRYFNDNYVAFSSGNEVTIMKGNYPHSSSDTTSLQPFATFTFSDTVQMMSFSPEGNYLTVQNGLTFASYDIEHEMVIASVVQTTGPDTRPLKWLNSAYLAADDNGELTFREFDGANIHSINAVTGGFDETLSPNGRFVYSILKASNGTYNLQRVKLILD